MSIPAAAKSPSRRFDRRLTAILAVAVGGLGALAVAIGTSLSTPEPPPATGAAALVPADALAYVHLSTDTSRPAVRSALRLAGRLSDLSPLSAAVDARLGAILTGPGSAGGGFDFATEVRPWLGKEAAFALLNTASTTAQSLIILDVRSRARATAFLQTGGARQVRVYRGVAELRYRRGTVLAFVRHYLVIGQGSSVEGAIDTADGYSSSLPANPAYRSAASREPADRVLDAYVSASGVQRVLAPRGGLLGAAGALLAEPGLSAATISLSAEPGGARVTVHSALDRTGGRPAPRFEPTLPSALPAGSSLLLDAHGLARAAPTLLAATATAGIAPQVGPLLRRLGAALASEGVDVPQALSLFSDETAVAVTPTARPAGRGNGGPALVILARTRHPDQSRALLAELEGPLAQLFPPPSSGPGQAAEWSDVQVAGVAAHQLSIAPGLQVDYAVFRGLVVVSTSLRAIGAIVRHESSLADTAAYDSALAGRPAKVSSLLFLDFSQLLNLGEQMGLMRGVRPSALRTDLENIRAVGLSSTRGEADTTAELFLQIK